MSSSLAFESAAMIRAASASSSLPWERTDSRIARRRSLELAKVAQPLVQRPELRVVERPVASLRYRAMNGTVAPPSSSSMAALT